MEENALKSVDIEKKEAHKVIKLCDYCENSDAGCCDECSMNDQVAGRDLCIDRMKEKGLIQDSAKLRNIVQASEIVLFKDLCRVLDIPPYIANKITTNEMGKKALEDHLDKNDLIEKFMQFLSDKDIAALVVSGLFDNIDYVYDLTGMVYGSSIHASGVLLSEEEILLPIDPETGDCHCNGGYAESLGHIKYDLLSLNTLKPISDILGMDIDWESNVDDENMVKDMQTEDLSFVFQFGSPIVDHMIKGVKPESIDVIGLSEVTSINRPGPLNIGLNRTWVDVKNGVFERKEEVDEIIGGLETIGALKI